MAFLHSVKSLDADVHLSAAGANFMFYPVSPAAKEFVAENVDPGAPKLGAGVFVEAKYVEALVEGAIDAGLDVYFN